MEKQQGFLSYRSLDHLLYEMSLKGIEAKKIDEAFQEKKKHDESKFLSKVSSVLITLWELTEIIMKSSPGTQVIIDADSGRIFRGKVDLKRVKELPQRVPGRTSLEIDGDGRKEYYVAKSWVGVRTNPQKHTWRNSTNLAPGNTIHPVVDLFQEKLAEVSKADVTTNIRKEISHTYLEISIKDWPVTIGLSEKTNRVYYYIFEGKKYNLK